MHTPTEPMTPEGWTVTVWAAIVLFYGIAGVAFYWSFRTADPAKLEALRTVGLVFLSIATIMLIAKKLIAMFLDS